MPGVGSTRVDPRIDGGDCRPGASSTKQARREGNPMSDACVVVPMRRRSDFRSLPSSVRPWLASLAMLGAATGSAAAQCPNGWAQGAGAPAVQAVFPGRTRVEAFAALPDGDILVGGSFTGAGGVPASRIARFRPSTNTWSALGSGVNAPVLALAVMPDGDYVVTGEFTSAGGVAGTRRIARYAPATGVWSPIGSPTEGGLYSVVALPDGDVLIGGGTILNDASPSQARIARYDAASGLWTAIEDRGTQGGTIHAMLQLPGGDVVIAGSIQTIGGVTANGVARYSPSTGLWSAMGAGVGGLVWDLALLPDGDVVAAGVFSLPTNGDTARNIARYDDATDEWTAMGPGVDGEVNALGVMPDGSVLAGADFETAGGITANGIARCNPSTNTWTPLENGIQEGRVRAIIPLGGREVLVGGHMSKIDGVTVTGIARFTFDGTPIIASQSLGAVVCPPGTAVVSVGVDGGGSPDPVTHQWQLESPPQSGVWTDLADGAFPGAAGATVSGATESTLSIAVVQPMPAARVRCVASTACGSTPSVPAIISVSSTDFDGDGDEGTDADIEAFFAAIGGGACPTGTCGSIDFDGDGDEGTDADIEAFFRVVGGGACVP